jgi:hypothetical protein
LALRAAATATAAVARSGASGFADQAAAVASGGVVVGADGVAGAAARIAVIASVSAGIDTTGAAAVEPAVPTGTTDEDVKLLAGFDRDDRVHPARAARRTSAGVGAEAAAFATQSDYGELADARRDFKRLRAAGVLKRFVVLDGIWRSDRYERVILSLSKGAAGG